MAKTELPDDSFIREVDEEYRRDQMKGLWARYGRLAIVAVVLGLAALAGGLYWRSHSAERAGATGENFTQALAKVETGDVAAATPALVDIAKTGGGYGALATLQQAANAMAGGDTDKARQLYKAVQDNAAYAAPFRDLALVKGIQLDFDTLKSADIVARLKPLAVPGNAWFGVAGEMTALAQLRDGKPDLAVPLLTAIAADTTLPSSLRARTEQLLATLAPAAPKPFAPTLAK